MQLQPEFYEVAPGKLLAGNYPNAFTEEELRAKIRFFLQNGVTFFVDLTEEGEMLPYAPVLGQEADDLGITVEHQRMPVRDFDIPSINEMKQILDTIDAAVAAGHMVYVHCHFGLGRTGTVAGCYLVRHGLRGEQALAELVDLRLGTRFEGIASPVTAEQREMVKAWPVGG
jgi:protein-tyrosine phosphatase